MSNVNNKIQALANELGIDASEIAYNPNSEDIYDAGEYGVYYVDDEQEADGRMYEWISNLFDELDLEEFEETIGFSLGDYIDFASIAKDYSDVYGRGCLSVYDGEELKIGDYYAYRYY